MDQIQQAGEQQREVSNKYYYCRICKKGFACGRALGGHMRAHGIKNEEDEDEDSVDMEPSQPYALRSNPNRLKTNRACENCGMEFSSWKSSIEHGRCGTGSRDGDHVDDRTEIGGCGGWSKGKRTLRRAVVFDEPSSGSQQDDMAASCLVLLSTARVEDPVVVTETEESCASASRYEEEDSKKKHPITGNGTTVIVTTTIHLSPPAPRGLFECKACKRAFTSHQALGGHRASHKKVKGCFSSKLNTDDETAERMVEVTPTDVVPQRTKKGKMHECTICHRVFTSGQALGGHKRCHWLLSGNNQNHQSPSPYKIHVPPPNDDQQLLRLGPMSMEETTSTAPCFLDLNLPAATEKLQVPPDLLCLQNLVNETVEGDVNGNHDHVKEVIDHEDEERRKEKVAKLSELMDVTMAGESSQWLQVGIQTCTNVS